MKVQVSKEWIDSNDQFLFIINAVPKDNPGKLQTQGKYLNNGSFVVDLGKGGWAYIKYIDQITIIESDTAVSIVDSASIVRYILPTETDLLYKPVRLEDLEPRPPLRIFKEKFITFPKLDEEDLEIIPSLKTLKKEVVSLPELDDEEPEPTPLFKAFEKETTDCSGLDIEYLEPISSLMGFGEEFITFLQEDNQSNIKSLGEVELVLSN